MSIQTDDNTLLPGSTGLWGLRDGTWKIIDSTAGDGAAEFLDDQLYHTKPMYVELGYIDFKITEEDPNAVFTNEDRKISHEQGWDVVESDGAIWIGLYHPLQAWTSPRFGERPKFTTDEGATEFVLKNAKTDSVCRKAIRLVYGF